MVFTVKSAKSIDFKQIRPDISNLQSSLVEWRRRLHQKPELAFEEQITSEFIQQQLQEWNIPYQGGIAQTGVVAIIESDREAFPEGNRPGKVLAIRADMDALPVQEANEVPYKSQHEGKMHACGHDGHTAIALGTAYYLQQHRDQWQGTVKIIFQPAEEGPGGAKPMIEEGVLRNPDVDAIIGLHLWNNLPLGTVGVRPGALMAAVECFRASILGKGGHGAMPNQTVDSIVVASQIVNALQTIVSRNVNPLDSAVVTVGEFHAGTALNVIADQAHLSGTIRYFKPELEPLIRERLQAIVAGVCQMHGAGYKLDHWQLYPPTINDQGMAELVRSIAMEVVETPLGVVPECQTMGGEDMSFFLNEVPGCYFFLGSANPEKKLAYPHHHPRFDFDETALSMGVEIFIRCVEKYLGS